jgi:periplasmic divalent cation tolerance protein
VRVDLVIVTHPDSEAAERLVSNLVSRRLIACGHLLPRGTSLFFWDGSLQREEEVTLLLKTIPENRELLEQEILREHPYQVPEILFLAADHVTAGYAAWVRESCKAGDGNSTGEGGVRGPA